ncbi:HPr-rel-A system PqqD family peptide chaperone [Niveibacterium sp. 24ML]|uniref:HPr-rel-A system PqqD family peptide chaperone n=1 Tax=Niveibacterium sp. 24ML TaxID=2985512 RepID=UPI00226F8F5C|nr:HPr-rel-A system PqqD family peptide chaperone [Niveibacterium sp. 24ML]MCX9154596.1 HPr-rel-A system PqqD family peptide chaperone [Niveibacterium sp. 24ML]
MIQLSSPESRWARRDWPDGSVVYDRRTGSTHALSPLAAEVLALSSAARYDPDAACAALCASLSIERSHELLAAVSEAIDQLQRIELI